MDDPEWEIEKYSINDEDKGGSVVKWMLNIGKKMAVTGIVISSAPPLLVFSAIGFAFSVPFGLVFAGYACTNKLITILLPPPPLLMDDEYYTSSSTDGDECFKLGLGDDVVEEANEEVVFESDDRNHVDEIEEYVMSEDPLVQVDEIKVTKFTHEEDAKLICDIGTETTAFRDVKTLTKPIKNVESLSDDDDETKLLNTRRQLGGGDEDEIRNMIIQAESVGTHEITTKDVNAVMEQHLNADSPKIDHHTINTKLNLEVGKEFPAAAAGDDENVDLSPLKPAPLKMPFRDEKLDDEKKMWEKIGAMRRIVGYKDPRQATCIEELKALYVFTGVEPPPQDHIHDDDDSDHLLLDEVNVKLKFLMAIVGVK